MSVGAGSAAAHAQSCCHGALQPAARVDCYPSTCLLLHALQVSYLRGIFPEDHYKTVDMRNLDSEAPQPACRRAPLAAAVSVDCRMSCLLFPHLPHLPPLPADMSISMLMQRDDESKRLVQWVEGGAARGCGTCLAAERHCACLLQPHAPTTHNHLLNCTAHLQTTC